MTAVADWFRAHGIDPATVEAWHIGWEHAYRDGEWRSEARQLFWSHAGGTGRLGLSVEEFTALSDAAERDGWAAR